MCLARAVPKRGGSCGNSPQAADGSVLFRSMPFPCPQNIRSLIMAARRRQQPATVRFNYVLRCSRPTPLRARSACYATLRNFGVACSERSLNYRYLAKIRSKPDDSQGKKGMARNESRSCELGGKFERYTEDRNSYEVVCDKSSICRKLCKRYLFYIVIAPLIFLYVFLRIKIPTR